ncbi:MAG: S1C family serine protease [Sphingomonadaceae bacterium]
MVRTSTGVGAERLRFLAVAATLALCLVVAALLTSGLGLVFSNADGPATGSEVPYLGITYVPLSHELAARYGVEAGTGVLVTDVAEGSPARRAGLRRGDILLSVDSVPLSQPSTLIGLLSDRRSGDRIPLQRVRDGQTAKVELILGARR